ncbi:MAG: helicase-related protein [Myxococcales bacterium]|nr:helicase-related protein [Myxococcales bacterium]
MSRPDVDEILTPLKPFQRRTVDHAFERLFLAADSTARFLVADEVGLGKTLVARGIIARTIDHLWDTVDRIDIVYICSNGSIARANLPKLKVSAAGERSFALATRLTMLATELAPRNDRPGLGDSKLNFVSFTPGTSFDMGHATGRSNERVVLFRLLEPLVEQRTALKNFLQGNITRTESWRWRLENDEVPLAPSIKKGFERAFRADHKLQEQLNTLFDTWFFRQRENWPREARWGRNEAIAALRQLLAGVCVQALEPDLVIMDEFQRFKSLLETREEYRDPAAELAQALFRATTPEGHPVRTLLLSATPYKLYTADAEIEHEDHYADFLATTRFLMNEDETRVEALRHDLSAFGAALKRAAAGDASDVDPAKAAVEGSLRAVMARTERVAASEDRDAMVTERHPSARLTVGDVHQYLAADALFRAVGDRDPMPYWKSAPYLAHFMHGYKVNERLDEALQLSPNKVSEVLHAHRGAFLRGRELETWLELDPGHAKMRDLASELLESGHWRLLWMPPSIPYWPLEGPFAGVEGASKTLLFSAWNVVPDVVSAVLSYEAERRMAGGRLASYKDPSRQQSPLLRLSKSESGALSRHRLLLLLLPCLPLADEAHPLRAPAGTDRKEWVRSRVEELLAALPSPQEGRPDDRWEWAAPLVLDPGLAAFLGAWKEDEKLPHPSRDLFNDYVDDILGVDLTQLGPRPPGLAELLTELALGSPAVLAARSLLPSGIRTDERRRQAVVIADAFWRLFNRPTVITLVSHLARSSSDSEAEDSYWRLVLRYCQQGNLQAVLDEQWHLMWEQHAWSNNESRSEVAATCATRLADVVEPRASRVHARFFRRSRDGESVSTDGLRIRTDFALRFGDIRAEDKVINADAVRASFNSPFRPFVLASTSVGQEGLDFHPWCHRLVHWNLPGNPVDLEQREGRIHRYKGHAVRRNVAAAQAAVALERWSPGDDLWSIIFDLAYEGARAAGDSDLVPHWIAAGDCRIERHVPMLPYTKEVEAFQRLKRQLAAYRVVFGQPRQEELITLLDQAELDTAELRSWAVDLSPPIPE